MSVRAPRRCGETSSRVSATFSVQSRHCTGSGTAPPASRPRSDAAAPLKETLERLARMTYEQVCEVMAVFDTPEAVVERLQRFRQDFDMGRVICWFNPGGQVPHAQVMRSMEMFAAKVMPHF